MKIIVFGATGQTGKQLVNILAREGHTLTAFARNHTKVDTFNGKVTAYQGDARDPEAVARAIQGHDTVLTAMGTRSLQKNDLQEVFMRNLIAAMDNANIKRVIELSAWGAGDSYRQSSPAMKLIRKTLLKNLYDDKDLADALLLASDLDYTIVRPGRLTNKPARGDVHASLNGEGLSQSISRQDVAAFMVGQLSDATWVRKSPLIGY
jgi:uncharacterized protein YbjT (DUF2867 family)